MQAYGFKTVASTTKPKQRLATLKRARMASMPLFPPDREATGFRRWIAHGNDFAGHSMYGTDGIPQVWAE